MAVPIRSLAEVEQMREAGRLLESMLDELCRVAEPGRTTAELDRHAAMLIERAGARPGSPPAFPGVLTACVNEEVTHAIPSARILRVGDVLTIDLSIEVGAWYVDAARAVSVGQSDSTVTACEGLVDVVTSSLGPGLAWAEAARRIRSEAASRGLSLVEDLAGHGIGRQPHEPPRLEYGPSPPDLTLRPGMVVTLEPALTTGSGRTEVLDDGWTVVTQDRAVAAYVERTLAITTGGAEVLAK